MISIWLLIKQRKRGTKNDNEQQLQQKNGEGKSEQTNKQHTERGIFFHCIILFFFLLLKSAQRTYPGNYVNL